MKVRPYRPSDEARLRKLQNDFEWVLGDDLFDILVVADEDDRPIAIAGAWKLAEIHLVIDPAWATPGVRLEAVGALHQHMKDSLQQQNVGRAVTWFDKEMPAFERRMKRMGWVRSAAVSFHRWVR